jgi:hypothetical protein
MSVKAIIKASWIENAVTVMTRHASPIPLSHVRLSGPTGRQVVKHLVGVPPACFLEGRDNWEDVPDLAKTPEGEPLHRYAGSQQYPVLWPELTWQERAAMAESRGPWDLWVNARGWAHVNGLTRSGSPCVGIAVEAAWLDVLSAAAVAYRDDQMSWSEVSDEYKLPGGGSRLDVDNAVLWDVVYPFGDPEPPGGD